MCFKNVTASLIKSIQFQYVKSAHCTASTICGLVLDAVGHFYFQLVTQQFEPKKKDLKAI